MSVLCCGPNGRGFQYGVSTASAAARSRFSTFIPIDASEIGAPFSFARSYSPPAADSVQMARAILLIASGTALALNASACGSTTVWTSA